MAEAKETKDTVEFLGKSCQVTRTDKGTTEKITMSKGDFDAVLEERGVTAEVRKVVKAAHDDIFKKVAELSRDRLLSVNKGKKLDDPDFVQRSYVVLGKGDGAMETTLDVHKVRTGTDVRTKEPFTKEYWGTFSGTVGATLAQEIRQDGGLLSEISTAFEKAWGKKKK